MRSPSTQAGPRILGAHLEGPFSLLSRAPRNTPGLCAPRSRSGSPRAPARSRSGLADDTCSRAGRSARSHRRAAGARRRRPAWRLQRDGGRGGGARVSTAVCARSRTSSTRCRRSRHRDPGLAGAALARDDIIVQLILDGDHLADETAAVVWKAAAGRVALVTDAIGGDRRRRWPLSPRGSRRRGTGRRRPPRRGWRPGRRSDDSARRNSQSCTPSVHRFLLAIAAATSVPARVAGRVDGVLRAGGNSATLLTPTTASRFARSSSAAR